MAMVPNIAKAANMARVPNIARAANMGRVRTELKDGRRWLQPPCPETSARDKDDVRSASATGGGISLPR